MNFVDVGPRGELDISHFGNSPAAKSVPPEWRDKVLYGRLRSPYGEVDVMDAPPGRASETGGNVAISIDVDDENRAAEVFANSRKTDKSSCRSRRRSSLAGSG